MKTDWHEMLFKGNPNPMWIYDRETLAFLSVNDAAIQHYGYSRNDFLEMTIKDICQSEALKRFVENVTSASGEVDAVSGTWKHLKRDGTVIAAEITSHAVTYNGRPAEIVVSRDVTERVRFEGERDKLIHDLQKAIEKLETEARERKDTEKFLRESEEQFKSLADESPNMIFINRKGHIVYANRKCEEMMGYKREDFYSPDFNFLELIAPEYLGMVKNNFIRHMKGEEVTPYEYALLTRDGKRIESIITTKLIDYEGVQAILGIVTDITDRKMVEEVIKTSLREKEALLQEIHHRVKNNMQIVSSLLRLQSRLVKDPESLELFRESQNRIHSIALIHEKLYKSERLASIDFRDYTSSLAQTLFNNYCVDTERISLKIDMHDVSLNTDTAIPCGLIINELVSNCLKHAFPRERKGEIAISLRWDGTGRYVLSVTDNGSGMPAETELWKKGSLGIEMVTMLAEEQLMGTVEFLSSKGTQVIVTFREVGYKKRVR